MRPATEIRLEEPLDATGFLETIARSCEPVVLRGACRHWPATSAAGQSWDALASYLMQKDSGVPAELFVGEPSIGGSFYYSEDLSGFNFDREPSSLSAALARISGAAGEDEPPSLYMGSLPADRHVPGFRAENRISFVPEAAEPRLWIGNASHVACHFDTFDNLACVVAGRRSFTLYAPQCIAGLYVGPIDRTMAGQPVAMAAEARPGDPRFPRFQPLRETALVAELGPGDALYLPKLWWHQVDATGAANLLVNYWWDAWRSGPDAPYTTMMLAMTAIASRPEPERAAWKAFFDHYVFRSNGHPLEHLPVSEHGILADGCPNSPGRIRAMAMQLLRGG